MHYLALVIIPPEGNVDAHVTLLMEPHQEQGDIGWDWYQVGGRWTGLFSGYDPGADPENTEPCNLCDATGKRTDAVAQSMPEQMAACHGCNGCDGKGIRRKWPTDWKRHDGDVLTTAEALAKMTPEKMPHTIVAHDIASVNERWNGKDFVKNLEHDATVRTLLARPGRVVVVDYHS